ncbi:RtcB family protein [Breznakiellaceae bacterium SP9]
MQVISGKYTEAKVFASIVEPECLAQVKHILDQEFMAAVKVRLMPDTHAGSGICIGYTATVNGKIVPAFIGVDIGCGMTALHIGRERIDFAKLDNDIRHHIPVGLHWNKTFNRALFQKALSMLPALQKERADVLLDAIGEVAMRVYEVQAFPSRVYLQLGSLGGGNHYLAVNEDESGAQYFTVHSGSRNFGKKVCEYHQKIAKTAVTKEEMAAAITQIKKNTERTQIGVKIQEYIARCRIVEKPPGMEYLEGKQAEQYLHDMDIAQKFAQVNRMMMIIKAAAQMGWKYHLPVIESIHNYIDLEHGIIRKGATAAYKGQLLLIPLNMRDGTLLCRGRGNEDWNCSAPHGAGRIMSRKKAMASISLAAYQETMETAGVWTSSVSLSTIDESPFAYKAADVIKEDIADTVELVDHWKEVYNLKAQE